MARILLIDDDPGLREALGMALEDAGHDVVLASDGREGLLRLAEGRAAVVVSDVNMPRMDGFTFIKNLREQEAYRDIPIIVLSTEGQDKDIETGLTLGANLYMVKPAQPEKMVRNVKMLLG